MRINDYNLIRDIIENDLICGFYNKNTKIQLSLIN